MPDLPDGSTTEELALIQAACAVGREELAGLALLRLCPQAQTNSLVREWLEAPVTVSSEDAGSITPIARPRSFTPAELSAELERRLTAEERQLVVNPVEITPEVAGGSAPVDGLPHERVAAVPWPSSPRWRSAAAVRATAGNERRAESLKDSTDPETRLSCQEHAKLFVAFARALGLNAWLVRHRPVRGRLAGLPRLRGPVRGWCRACWWIRRGAVFGIQHQEFTVLDDLQAISHQAMQPGPKRDPRRLRMGLKLNPEDRWTRLQFVRGMAKPASWTPRPRNCAECSPPGPRRGTCMRPRRNLEVARQRWKPALAELQRALALSPSNAVVHFQLAGVYCGT